MTPGVDVTLSSIPQPVSRVGTGDASFPGLWSARVSGVLDTATGARLLRLVDAQLELVTAGSSETTHILIDLTAIVGIEPGGVATLRHALYSANRRGAAVWLAGCTGNLHRLPLQSRQILYKFRIFPSVEAATQEFATRSVGADTVRRPQDTERDHTP